jgi:hypothetical protein
LNVQIWKYKLAIRPKNNPNWAPSTSVGDAAMIAISVARKVLPGRHLHPELATSEN